MVKKIIYPSGANSSESISIAVTAPSSGLGNTILNKRFDLVRKQHEDNGMIVIEGRCLRENENHVSASIESRVKELHDLIEDPKVTLIQPPWGGEVLIELLEFFDFKRIEKAPTWIQGYSDISTLLFAITVKTGVATVQGPNFMESVEGQEKLTHHSRDYLFLKNGDNFTQESSEKWQKYYVDFAKQIDACFNLTENTHWALLHGTSANFSGRLIGGCIDTIKHLIGTPYGDLPGFVSEFSQGEGVVLHLENCELSPPELYRALVSMKYAGWFDHLNAVVFGRNSGPDDANFSYEDSIGKVFEDKAYPVVLNADIGHKPPQMTLINGAVASFSVNNHGQARLTQKLC